jgi:hypothetical protein
MGRLTEMFEAQKDREKSSTVEIVTCPKCQGENIVPDINGDGSFGTFWCANCKHEFRRKTVLDGFAAGLRQYGPWAIGVMIIGLAAFYGQDQIKAIWRDVVDLAGGVK